jgi:hypothetical protein
MLLNFYIQWYLLAKVQRQRVRYIKLAIDCDSVCLDACQAKVDYAEGEEGGYGGRALSGELQQCILIHAVHLLTAQDKELRELRQQFHTRDHLAANSPPDSSSMLETKGKELLAKVELDKFETGNTIRKLQQDHQKMDVKVLGNIVETSLSPATHSITELRARLQETDARCEQLKQDKIEKENTIQKLSDDVDRLRSEMQVMTRGQGLTKNHIIQELRQNVDQLKQQPAFSINECDLWRQDHEVCIEKIKNLQTQLNSCLDDTSVLLRKSEVVREVVRKSEDSFKELTADPDDLRETYIDAANQHSYEFKAELNALRQKLDCISADSADGKRMRLGHLSVTPDLRVAVDPSCIPKQVCADVCRRVLAYADVCCRMLPYADVC